MRVRHVWFTGLLLFACTSAATKRSVRSYEAGDYQAAAAEAERGIAADRSDEGAWRMRVRAALALGDSAAIADSYDRYRQARGDEDLELVTELAQVTIAQGLTSPSTALRIASIRAVEESELFALADQVAERMTDRDDRVVATAAAAVLRGYADAVTALDDMLRSEDAEARRIAVDGLGRKVARNAIAELTAAASDGDAGVRRVALGHLGKLHDEALAPTFTQHLRDADDSVRTAAVQGLAGLASRAPAATAPAVAVAMRDASVGVRLAAVELAAAVRDRAALQVLSADADATVALEAVAALGLGPAVATPIVERALGAAEWSTRVAALNHLQRALGLELATTRARAALGDPELAVRLAAARVLAHAGARAEAIPVFAAALEDKEAGPRALEAAVDLCQLGDARGPAALARALREASSAEARAQAAAAHRLARTLTPALVAALADASGSVRIAAAAALSALAKATPD